MSVFAIRPDLDRLIRRDIKRQKFCHRIEVYLEFAKSNKLSMEVAHKSKFKHFRTLKFGEYKTHSLMEHHADYYEERTMRNTAEFSEQIP